MRYSQSAKRFLLNWQSAGGSLRLSHAQPHCEHQFYHHGPARPPVQWPVPGPNYAAQWQFLRSRTRDRPGRTGRRCEPGLPGGAWSSIRYRYFHLCSCGHSGKGCLSIRGSEFQSIVYQIRKDLRQPIPSPNKDGKLSGVCVCRCI